MHCLKKVKSNNLRKVEKKIKKALRIFRFLLFYAGSSNKVKKITINLYLTNSKKSSSKKSDKNLK